MNYLMLTLDNKTNLSVPFQLMVALCGFASVSAIAINTFGIMTLREAAFTFTFPAFFLILSTAISFPKFGKLVLKGFIAGIIAVTLYDTSRLPFIIAGWQDFIPKIGDWLLEEEGTSPLIGYAWRYLGNAGGMGAAFAILFSLVGHNWRRQIVKIGMYYGLFIFACLMLTLLISPYGQELMFKLTPLNVAGSLTGHIIYGLVLGIVFNKLSRR